MIKKNGGIFGRNPTYNDVVVEGVLTLKEAQVFDNDITINGDLTVNGTETVINTVELNVDDKNITMGAVVAKVGLAATTNITAGQFTVQLADTSGLIPGMTVTKTAGTGAFGASPKIASVDSRAQITLTVAHATSGTIIFDTGGATDDTADGGGITLKGATDKLITWVKAKTAWVFNQAVEAPDATLTNLTASLPVFTDANKKLVTQSQQNALNAIAGATTAAQFLRGDGTNVSMSAIQASDVPTLNQSTTGSAGSVKSNATTGLLQVAGPGAGATRVMTTPDANFTAARTDAAQTFTGAQTFGNLKLDTNTLSSTNSNGNINITPNGTGAAVFGRYVTIGDGVLYSLDLNGNPTYNPTVNWKTNGSMRFALLQGVTESGSNAGSDLTMYRYTDAGGYLGGVLEITRSNGNVKVMDGNLVIGTSGKGIDFSATANSSGTMTSELLADYEEGTCTLAITCASGTATVNSYYRLGAYTKVGRKVTVTGFIVIDSVSTPSGTWSITGLPYAAGSDAHGNFQSAASFSQITTGVGHVGSGGTAVQMISPNANTLAASTQIIFEVTYQV